jgi:flavodoxin
MKVLVEFETMFGNTKQIAEAVAAGLATTTEVTIDNVVHAPIVLPDDVDALILGGPTHAFSMSRQSTREDAMKRGAVAGEVPLGIREWLQALPEHPRPFFFAAFDTRTDMALVPGAASRSASRFARKKGFHVLEPKSFYVQGYQGPLVEGELERARQWGEDLGTILTGARPNEGATNEPAG